VRIEHPDLPKKLSEAAGELMGALWTRAAASAHAELTSLRDDVEARRAEAEQKVVAAREELGRTESALEQRTAALLAAQVEIQELERQQAHETAVRQALEAQVKPVGEEVVARERDLDKVATPSRVIWKNSAKRLIVRRSAYASRKSVRSSKSIANAARW
jgi:chromosome segregation ATPase